MPLGPDGGEGSPRDQVRDAVSPAEVRQAVRNQYRTLYQQDPTDNELEHWQKWFMREARKQVAKGRPVGRAVASTQARFIERFGSTPQAKAEFERLS